MRTLLESANGWLQRAGVQESELWCGGRTAGQDGGF